MIISDDSLRQYIMKQIQNGEKPAIVPFVDHQVKLEDDVEIISYGLSSYGYDIRCDHNFKIFRSYNKDYEVIDPKNFDHNLLQSQYSTPQVNEFILLPPHSFALTMSLEYIRVPRDTLAICMGKSTYARCGIILNTTPLEPEWEGHITLELSNTTSVPAKIYVNEGIAQLLFIRGNEICKQSYADKKGKYQGQKEITTAKV